MNVTNSLILNKSQNNKRIATIAVENKCLDAAVSRFYYSVFQRILHFLYSEIKNYNSRPKDTGMHEKVIGDFVGYVNKQYIRTNKIDKAYALSLTKINYLKLYRVDADYSPVKTISEEFYTKEYLPCYNSCITLLEKVENI